MILVSCIIFRDVEICEVEKLENLYFLHGYLHSILVFRIELIRLWQLTLLRIKRETFKSNSRILVYSVSTLAIDLY